MKKTAIALVMLICLLTGALLPALAEMPIDPALAALTDAGDIESFQGTWLDGAADRLEKA